MIYILREMKLISLLSYHFQTLLKLPKSWVNLTTSFLDFVTFNKFQPTKICVIKRVE